jgi:uroporphyrinogen decarboxylase
MPVLHFGFWQETLEKWADEGHLTHEEIAGIDDGADNEQAIADKLGFDANYFTVIHDKNSKPLGWYDMPLFPVFEEKIVERYPDGKYAKLDIDGVIVLSKPGAVSIPHEVGHTLVDRASWEKYYVPKLKWTEERLDTETIDKIKKMGPDRERFYGVYCASLYGKLRNYWGIVELSYLQADDLDLYQECVDTIADVTFECVKHVLETGVQLDFAHYWEDICFKGGPLVKPDLFRSSVGKHYKRISELCHSHGIDIISLDCDGYVDNLVPIWLDNGVNTMFPIEVGAWDYSFGTMREKFGKDVRGVGNMDKRAFSKDKKAIDSEIDRLRRLVDLGGFIPCPDHRIAPDAEWDLVQYYCKRMHEVF